MAKNQHINFNFFNTLNVRLSGQTDGMAAKRFSTKYQHYLTPEEISPDLTIELGEFSYSSKSDYLYTPYRSSKDYFASKQKYKISKWKYECDGFGKFPSTLKLDGNLPAQISMIDMTAGTYLLWYLSLKSLMPVHAAAVSKDSKATIFTGRRGVGKTTIVGHCLRNGYKMISEDRVFMKNGEVHGFRVPANIKYDRADPNIAKLPAKTKLKVHRNRLLSIFTLGYFTLLEPVPLESLIPDKLVDSGKAAKLVYLQSGPELKIDDSPDKQLVVEQIIQGNRYDSIDLCRDMNAYKFCFPDEDDYWQACHENTLKELSEIPVVKITVPVKPTQTEWDKILEVCG